LRIDHNDEDALVEGMITASRIWVETFTRRALITQTWDYLYERFMRPHDPLLIPRAPLQMVSSIFYVDEDGDAQELDDSFYAVRVFAGQTARRGYIELADNVTLPSLSTAVKLPVIVRAECGYGDTSGDVPSGILSAMYLMLGDLYEQRQTTVTGAVTSKTQTTVEKLLGPYRLYEVP